VVSNLEQAGIPAVAIIFQDMSQVAENYRRQIRMSDMRNILVPRMTSPEKSKAFAPELLPKIVMALTTPLTDKEQMEETILKEIFPRITVTGTWDECQEYFQGDSAWTALFNTAPPSRFTKGQPVVLPTEEKVRWMLTGTSHKAAEIMGSVPVPADQKEFTVETVAINAVMAGCKPEYMPLILAMAEMMGTPAKTRVSSRLGGAHQLLGVVSGPIGKELRLSTDQFSGAGYHTNYSLRIAMDMIGRNAIGHWGVRAEAGSGFFAEDIDQSPWTTLGVDAGFKPDDNVFALCVANSPNERWISPAWYRAHGKFLERMVPVIQDQGNSLSVTIIIHPSVANDLAAKGMSKEDVKQWLWEQATETMGHYRDRTWYGIMAALQTRPGPFNRSEIFDLPDDAIIHTFKNPEMIQIIVAGIPMEFGYVAGGPMWLPSELMTSIDKWR